MQKVILTALIALLMVGCGSSHKENGRQILDTDQISLFTSSDKVLENSYSWAKKRALGYAHDGSDPVGHWYEAALPQREAFCMRDVSHQSVGAQILGLAKHNKNMFLKFAENITESKDWCTYWEINRYNKPAPADYTNDSEFWYNLNANFDLIQACLKMYNWSGDTDYLNDPIFTNFYDISVNQYIERWMLEPENVMNRPQYMNQPENFSLDNNFHTCRGLPSYVENFRGLTMGADLLAALYAGFDAYATIATLNNEPEKAKVAKEKAAQYRAVLDGKWWDEENERYNTFWTKEHEFFRGEGVPLILWFNATDKKDRIRASVADILEREWNVENISSFPALFYRLGYFDEAYRFLVDLPQMNRAEYPEVSYGVVEGIIGGAMGVVPNADSRSVGSCSRFSEDTQFAEVTNVPVFDGYISVRHENRDVTHFTNNTAGEIVWEAAFIGDYAKVVVDNKEYPTVISQDVFGHTIATCKVAVAANSTLTAQVSEEADLQPN